MLQNQQFSDDQILQMLQSESTFEQGFRVLMQTYRERLYWHIRRMVQVHEDADDILQNTFIKAYKGLDGFEGKSKLSTWLYRIAVNESITFMQARSRKATDSLDAHAFALQGLVAEANPDLSLLQEHLSFAIADLPDKQRVVFNMRYFEEMPYDDISKVLDTSVGALKASFHHAVKKIERYFTEKDL